MITRILAALSISALLSSCAMTRANSLRMLDERSQYESEAALPPLHEAGIEGFKNSPAATRTHSKVAAFWVHPTKTSDGSFFWGGWLSVLLEKGDWVLSKPGKTPKAEVIRAIKKSGEK